MSLVNQEPGDGVHGDHLEGITRYLICSSSYKFAELDYFLYAEVCAVFQTIGALL